MDAEEYGRMINDRDVLDQTTLNVTLKELLSRQEFMLAGEINRVLKDNAIEMPQAEAQAAEGTNTFYKIDLDAEDLEKIIDIFFELEASYMDGKNKHQPTAAFYASLADKWERMA